MKVDELAAIEGARPRPPSSPLSEETTNEIISLFYEIYVPGLDLFFETRWYDFKPDSPGVKNPLSILRLNTRAMETFAAFLEAVRNVKTTDPADMVQAGHMETWIILELARLPYVAAMYSPARPPSIPLPPEDDPIELRSRVQVFEALLAGEVLPSNPLFPPPQPSAGNHSNEVRARELEFWYNLGNFLLQAHWSPSKEHTAAREQCLTRLRSLLDGRENRDVLYSICVLREYTMQFDATSAVQTAPDHLDEREPQSRLAVATRFIQDESSKMGTTNVVRRLADLACRAYVRPGANVRRGY